MSVEFTAALAGCTVRITALFTETKQFCRDYLTDCPSCLTACPPDMEVCVGEAELESERARAEENRRREGLPEHRSSDSYVETLAVYRRLAEQLPGKDRLLCHGSALAMDEEGYLFTAKSGTGKSTHSRLWRECFGDRVVMVNDDKPILSVTAEGAAVWGTPWDGKHHLSRNMSVPLKALCVLQRGEENHIERLTKEQAYPHILKQVYRPANVAAMAQTLELLDRLMKTVPIYLLRCNMEREAAIISYEGMQNQ